LFTLRSEADGGNVGLLTDKAAALLRPAQVGVMRPDIQAEGGKVIVCQICAHPLQAQFEGKNLCAERDWDECAAREEARYLVFCEKYNTGKRRAA
jgi:hypothetical protein